MQRAKGLIAILGTAFATGCGRFGVDPAGTAEIGDEPRYPAIVLADAPVGYWRLGDSNVAAADASGNAIVGAYSGDVTRGAPGAIVDDSDTAAQFAGSNGVISVGNGFGFAGTAAYSIEAWVKPSAFDGNFRHVFTKQHRDGPKQGYALLVHDPQGILFERFVDGDGIAIDFPARPATDRFTHVVGTYDGAMLRLYINGTQVGMTDDDRPLPEITELAAIGAAGMGDAYFAGTIDEVAVYAAALSEARIRVHYAAGTTP